MKLIPKKNDLYGSPMYPYMIIVPRLLDLIDWHYSLKKGYRDSTESKISVRDSTTSFRKFTVADSKDRLIDKQETKSGRKKAADFNIRFSVSSMVSQTVSTIKKAIKNKDSKVSPEKEKSNDDSDARLVASIRDALRKVGEDPERALPLLNNVLLPDIDLKNSLDGMRPEAHTSLLTRLIIGIIDKLTENRPMAFFIDDVQWYVKIHATTFY
jgi:hypothetical protein